jgi:formate-dependent phosphoribosylglycinamide formyltransferase (GAR transformylase)
MDTSATVGVTVTDAVGAGVGVVFGIEIAVGEGAVAGVSSSTHPANTTTAAIIAMAIKSLPRGSYRFMQCSQPHNDI